MKNTLFLLTTLISIGIAHSQVDFKQIVPPNPNVAALFKSEITPVNEYNGLPNISIPFYTVQEGAISVPLSLSYTPGGIQVGEESGIVGLGWSLLAGGAITRTVNGVDDFLPTYGYMAHSYQRPDMTLYNPGVPLFTNADANCKFPVNGTYTDFGPITGALVDTDFMPDMFHYNFNGYSGSFVLDKENFGRVVLIEKEGIKIEFVGSGTGQLFNIEFYVTGEDGTVYEFSQRADTQLPNGNVLQYTSTWYLTKITDNTGNFVDFSYQDRGWMRPIESFTQSWEVPTDERDVSNPSRKYLYYTGPKTLVQDIYLSEINFGHSSDLSTYDKVVFNYSDSLERLDVKTFFLKSFDVISRVHETVKNVAFNYSYFGSPFEPTNYNNVSIANGDYAQEIGMEAEKNVKPHLNLRLRLDSVVEDRIKVHSFEYFGSGMPVPNKTSFSQDYWGFFNNESNYGSFIPEIRDEYGSPLNFPQFNYAKRYPNGKYAKYFSLKKITYPTKGSTEFDYELNTYEPFNVGNIVSPPTVPMDETALAYETKPDEAIVITPNKNSTLTLKIDIVIRGWNAGENPNDPAPKPDIPSDKFDDWFYVTLEDLSGNIIAKRHIPSSEGWNLWNSFDPYNNSCENQNGSNCTRTIDCLVSGADYCSTNDCSQSYQPAIIFTCTEEWKYNNPDPYYRLTEDQYVLRAHFDDQGGLLYGQARLRAQWEDVEISATQDFATGGGLRLKSIIDRDIDNTIATKRNFNYHYKDTVNGVEVEKSYGRIKTLPNYFSDHRTMFYLKLLPGGNFTNYYSEIGLPKIVGKATSHNSFSKDAGSYVGYDQIEITSEGSEGDNGKTIKKFYNIEDQYLANNPPEYIDDYYQYPPVRLPINGLNYETEIYKWNNSDPLNPTYALVSESEKQYKVNGIYDAVDFDFTDLWTNTDVVISAVKERPVSVPYNLWVSGPDCNTYKFQFHPYFSNVVQQTGSIEKSYDENEENPVVSSQQYAYENNVHWQRTKTTTINSDGSILVTKVYYPDDISDATSLPEGGALESFTQINQLKAAGLHRIATPVQTTVTRNDTLMSVERNEFDTFGGTILKSKTQTAREALTLEDRLLYEEYANGNPVQLRREDGTPVAYIWGYNNTYPIAKVENATYSQLAAFVSNLQTYSNSDNDRTIDTFDINGNKVYTGNEGTLRQELNTLRDNLPGAMVTTYTYDPLTGVTSVTDPRGYCMYYQYDNLNRLLSIQDDDGHYVSDYRYNYTGQSGN